MKSLAVLMILSFAHQVRAQEYSPAQRRIDSLLANNDELINYRYLDDCGKIGFVDSIVQAKGEYVFSEAYFKLAITDIALRSSVDPNVRRGDFSSAYRNEQEYWSFSRTCRKKLKCKSKQNSCTKKALLDNTK